MTTTNEDQRVIHQPSQAGHYVVAAAIILAAVLLILFFPRNNGCCCCQAHPATTSTTTLGQLGVHIPPGQASPMSTQPRQFAVVPAAQVIPQATPAHLLAPTPEAFLATAAVLPSITGNEPYLPIGNLSVPSVYVECRKHDKHKCREVVNVDEAGSSLVWLGLGSIVTLGAARMRA